MKQTETILIYTKQQSNRLAYILDWIFNTYKIDYTLTTSISEFQLFNGNKINYSSKNIGGFWISPNPLLFEKDIAPKTIQTSIWNGLPTLFPQQKGDISFDIFAAAFYLISRYEEYLPTETDKHGRFLPENSILNTIKQQNKPIVDIWLNLLLKQLKTHFSAFNYHKADFNYIPTIDIDNALAYKHKSTFRTLASLAKKFLYLRTNELKEHIRVLAHKQKDPYDSYTFIAEAHKNTKPILFFLMQNKGKYDRNLSAKNIHFQRIIKRLNNFQIGIHPSYRSNYSNKLLTQEIATLKNITGNNIKWSRQHYLKLSFPKTYQNLINIGITEDYSMGHASQSGFRAGTARPFYFFDLKKDKKTSLRIFPFQLMDVTLHDYLKLTIAEAKQEIDYYIHTLEYSGGTFSLIFHNESLGNEGKWKNWRSVYEYALKKAEEALQKQQKDPNFSDEINGLI